MSTLKAEVNRSDSAEQPKPPIEAGRPHLRLVHGGLVEVIPVSEDPTGSEQALKNVVVLEQRGAKINISPDSSSVQVKLSKGQDALACSLLYGLEVMGLKRFPGKVHVAPPDIYDAISLFSDAKDGRGKAALEFSDGKLAIGYNYPGNAVFIKNLKGSKHNGLNGAPKRLLEEALAFFDIEAETAKIKEPLAWEQARGGGPEGMRTPWNSD